MLKNNETALKKLDWVKSKNDKILTLVYDLENETPLQSQDLVQCLTLFDKAGAFKRTIKIFLVITKVDRLQEYTDNKDSYEEIKKAVENRIRTEQPALINTIESIIEKNQVSKWYSVGHKIELEILPMSISTSLVKSKFIKDQDPRFIEEYAKKMEKGLLIRKM